MKRTLILLLLLAVCLPSYTQKTNYFKTITESIEPYETTVAQIEQKIGLAATETVIGPMKVKVTYFKEIGIGFLGTTQSHANYPVVHLKETNQQSDEYYFKRNLKVRELYQKRGEPEYYRYDSETGLLNLIYKESSYEITGVKLKDQRAADGSLPFKAMLPHIKDRQIDYLLIDFAYDTVPELLELEEID